MGELASALDALAADDLHGLPAPALLERTAELVRARNRLDAELARTVRRAETRPGPRARRAEVDGLLAARALPTSRRGPPGCWSATAAPWSTCPRSPPPAPPG